jgi:nucleoside-diphosphate-sugar epimerase
MAVTLNALTRDRLARHFRFDVGIRVLADLIIVNVSLLLGMLLTLLPVPLLGAPPDPESQPLTELSVSFGRVAPLVTVLIVGLFVMTGVYIRARFYRAGYKIPVLAQSITLAYLLVALASRMLGWPVPWSTVLTAWLITLLLAIGTRFLSNVRHLTLHFNADAHADADADAETEAYAEKQPGSGANNAADQPPTSLRTVLVIGGAGYIGSILCRQLLARGYRVRVLDALLYGDHAVRELVGTPAFELIEGDSRDISSLVQAVRGVDAVVHLGEIVGDPACALDEQVTLEINLAATRMAAEVTKGLGVQRFVYASSCSVYGAADGIVDERSGLNPVSLYARTKIGAERVLLSLRDQDFHPVIVRLATVYGLSYRPRFDLVVNTLTARAYADGTFKIFGGDQWRPFVHVADVAAALLLCLEKPLELVDGQIFNVGSDSQNYTIKEIGRLILAHLPHTQVQTVATIDDERDYHVSFSKIRNQLNFEPSHTIDDGVREIVDAMAAGQITSYSDPRYHNAAFLVTTPGSNRIRAFRPSPLYQANPLALEQLLHSLPEHVDGTTAESLPAPAGASA